MCARGVDEGDPRLSFSTEAPAQIDGEFKATGAAADDDDVVEGRFRVRAQSGLLSWRGWGYFIVNLIFSRALPSQSPLV